MTTKAQFMPSLTETQKAFIELEKQKPAIKEHFEKMNLLAEQLAAENGVGTMFQDDEGTVYKIVEPTGKFVYFEKFDVIRTRRNGERSGSLSIREAKEAGFSVE